MKSSDIRTVENLLCDRDTFDIRWHVTSICNYDCSFCIQGNRQAHHAQAEGESPEMRRQVCSALRRLIEGLTAYRSVKVSLIGGEVTILPDSARILESLALSRFPGEIAFDITTNFSAKRPISRRCATSFKSRLPASTAACASAQASTPPMSPIRRLRINCGSSVPMPGGLKSRQANRAAAAQTGSALRSVSPS